ncbi:MAG: hypothetical protein KH380_05760 [Coprobacillus sp.]|nr:hypothetical protein [Coprobacillus sp.]
MGRNYLLKEEKYLLSAKRHLYIMFIFLFLASALALFFNNFTHNMESTFKLRLGGILLFHCAITFILFLASSEKAYSYVDPEIPLPVRILLFVLYGILGAAECVLFYFMIDKNSFLFESGLSEEVFLSIQKKAIPFFAFLIVSNVGNLSYSIYKQRTEFTDKFNILYFLLLPLSSGLCGILVPVVIIFSALDH